MLITRHGAVMSLFLAGAALAHEGVQNPAVLERMELMKAIAAETEALGDMVKGEAVFDAERAALARARLVAASREVPDAFEARETDPLSEALPAVWTDRAGFALASEEALRAAEALQTGSAEALAASFAPFARSCRSCHEDYRAKR